MENRIATQALARGKAVEDRFEGLTFTRLLDSVAGWPRGSVVLPDGSVVAGYPSIGRLQSMEAGLRRHYAGPFWAEEKIDGFNVRIIHYGESQYAFSRGGFVCPFSTDRLPDLLDAAVFEHDPQLVICAEIAGPENPYLEGHPPQVTEDVALFVFDVMHRARPGFLPQQEKMRLTDRYGLPAARIFGRYRVDDFPALQDLILQLDAEGGEGLVFKGEDDDSRAKYVTGRSNVTDIALCADQLLDQPPEYFINRLLRLGLFASEHGRAGDGDLERSLGRAFLTGVVRAVERSQDLGRVGVPFRCRFRQRQNAEHFMTHMKSTGGRRIRISQRMPRREGEYWVLEFERVLERMTGTLANTLAGVSQYD